MYFDSEALLENGFLGTDNCCISSPPFTDALLDGPEVDGLLEAPEVDGLLDAPAVDGLLVDVPDEISVASNEDFEEDFLVSLDPIALALPLVTLTKVTPSFTSKWVILNLGKVLIDFFKEL